jgi:hypothetical protein
MKRIAILLCFTVATMAYTFDPEYVGESAEYFNSGSCGAFMDDPTDTTTDCYISCDAAGAQIYEAFSDATYNTAYLSSSAFANEMSIVTIKYMS